MHMHTQNGRSPPANHFLSLYPPCKMTIIDCKGSRNVYILLHTHRAWVGLIFNVLRTTGLREPPPRQSCSYAVVVPERGGVSGWSWVWCTQTQPRPCKRCGERRREALITPWRARSNPQVQTEHTEPQTQVLVPCVINPTSPVRSLSERVRMGYSLASTAKSIPPACSVCMGASNPEDQRCRFLEVG